MAVKSVLELTDANFVQEVIAADTPVLVDFWAEWCMPCRAIGPVVDDLANDYAGRVKVGKVDVDQNKQLATRFEVTSIPLLLIFQGGEVVKKFVGVTDRKLIAAELDRLIG